MKTLLCTLITSAALAACGGGNKPATTPTNAGSGGATGGQTYGKPAPTTDTHDGTQPPMPDPCASPASSAP